jgi:hypothetical protein
MEITATQLKKAIAGLPNVIEKRIRHGERVVVPLFPADTAIIVNPNASPVVGYIQEAEFICDLKKKDWILHSITSKGTTHQI